jgi:protein-S-isoprenylcysteine O-methyltransferase
MLEWEICVFCGILAFFHISEGVIDKVNHPREWSSRSFLVSLPYSFACLFGLAEWHIEIVFLPNMKLETRDCVMWVGLIMTVLGIVIRCLAQMTARKSFTRYLAYERVESHTLVTHGIYSVVRHPGYFGMFYFAVGTQVFLRNPVSLLVFIAVLWKFFRDRIEEEEFALLSMFGSGYLAYKNQTRTWIPFID